LATVSSNSAACRAAAVEAVVVFFMAVEILCPTIARRGKPARTASRLFAVRDRPRLPGTATSTDEGWFIFTAEFRRKGESIAEGMFGGRRSSRRTGESPK
jgi:hypothetical protein